MLNPKGRGLEIGPGYNPLFPKTQGYTVETVDHAPADELRRKYREMGQDPSLIEEVDHIWKGGPLDDLVRQPGAYDFIFASHVVEHIPDVLGFINACDRLLNDTGVLVLVVPDKRYCFDVFRPIASTGDIIQAHLDRRERHLPGKIFDHFAYLTVRNGAPTWDKWSNGPATFLLPSLEDARVKLEASNSDYVDAHGWQFVPSSFRLILNDLDAIGLTQMKEVAFHDSDGHACEFFISLSRSGRGCSLDRLSLCHRILYEQKVGHDSLGFTLASGPRKLANLIVRALRKRC